MFNNEEMERDGLVELVRKIVAAAGTAEEIDAWIDTLERSVPHPDVCDLICFPVDGEDLSPEQVVDLALAYQPTLLGD